MVLIESVRLMGCECSILIYMQPLSFCPHFMYSHQQQDKFRNMTFPENSHESALWLAGWPQAHFCSFSQKSIKMASALRFSNRSDPVKLFLKLLKYEEY